jgi:hypothetical protein
MRPSLTAVASARAAQIQKYLPPTSGGHIGVVSENGK